MSYQNHLARYYFPDGYFSPREDLDRSTVYLKDVKKLFIKDIDLMDHKIVRLIAVWDSSMKLLSIELKSNYEMKIVDLYNKKISGSPEAPKNFRKLIDCDTALKAVKLFLEFEEKELPEILRPYEEFWKQKNTLEKCNREEYNKNLELKRRKALEDHFVKPGDTLQNIANNKCFIVEEVVSETYGFIYKLNDNWSFKQLDIYKTNKTEKGTVRKKGWLWMGKIIPASKPKEIKKK